MTILNPSQTLILVVDDVPDNLAVLHDALDESGFTVLVASDGKTAITRAIEAQPDLILLDAIMPGMDGFQVCKALKVEASTSHIPVIFMTGLTEAEHVAAGFEAGGSDYVTKPIRPKEVLARIAAQLHTAKMMQQARAALDAFGQAALAIMPSTGKIVWQTPLAREWMQRYFDHEALVAAQTPEPVLSWAKEAALSASKNAAYRPFTMIQGANRLIFSFTEKTSDEQWMILLREESDAAQIEALITVFNLTKKEAEVLYWTIKGKTNRDIGDIVGSSPRTVNKHLEHVFTKLGVETRTAAASLASSKLRIFK